MGIFSKRKNSKKSPEVTEVLQLKKAEDGPPVLRLNSSECSLPEFGSARSGPPVTQRPCLKRATRSESSIYLKVHAVNNRLTQRASRDIGFEESTEYTSTTSSRSSSRSPKRVSFKLDSTNNFEQGKIRESRSLRKAIGMYAAIFDNFADPSKSYRRRRRPGIAVTRTMDMIQTQ